jgi:4-diphosphocytidyl-2-C-methyl-D-erythritol kinase
MTSLSLDSPAKINLMLSVHGQRGDGFHALTSLIVALAFGDRLHVSLKGDGVDFHCSDPEVPTGEANLIVRAACAFRSRTGIKEGFKFDLDKRIPMGAGLGGGSSNAAVALRAMNELTGRPLDRSDLQDLAADLGSDCPFFIDAVPAKMTGRGDILDPLPQDLAKQLRGRRVLIFRPDFGVNTRWAYRRLIEASPRAYEPEAIASARLNDFASSGELSGLLSNTFEACVGAKYLAIPCLLEELRAEGHLCLMSGSGSCCFALAGNEAEVAAIRSICLSAWGSGLFFIETSIL